MGMLSTYRLQLCQCLQRRLFKWKVWTEMNKMVLNLSTAQAFVSRVTGSSGLTLQPERKGIFWDNFYRWYVSMLIHFKELWFIAKWNLSQTLWQLSVMENAFLKKDFPPFCLCCLDDERGRYQIEEKKNWKIFGWHKMENTCKIPAWHFHFSRSSYKMKKVIQK